MWCHMQLNFSEYLGKKHKMVPTFKKKKKNLHLFIKLYFLSQSTLIWDECEKIHQKCFYPKQKKVRVIFPLIKYPEIL